MLQLIIPILLATSGCCSWHDGVDYCGSSGYYVCNDGTTSSSCTCEYVRPANSAFDELLNPNPYSINPYSDIQDKLDKCNTDLVTRTEELKAEKEMHWWTKLWKWIKSLF